MFEFKKLCDAFEDMSQVEKGLILTEKSVKILAKLRLLNLPEIDPVSVLAGFVIGSVVADGKIDEREYSLIYPALVKTFGDEYDFAVVKQTFNASDVKKSLPNIPSKCLKF